MKRLLFSIFLMVFLFSLLFFSPSSKGDMVFLDSGEAISANETAVIIIDMWDTHECLSDLNRIEKIAPHIDRVIRKARERGMKIIHAPYGTMGFYENYSQYLELNKTVYSLYQDVNIPDYDFMAGGCDGVNDESRHPSMQNPAIEIFPEDLISDDPGKVLGFLEQNNYKNIIYMGVHANRCMLENQLGIIAMAKRDFNVFLVRDLTEVTSSQENVPGIETYNELKEYVLGVIENNWADVIDSEELLH
ncbi:hypothetical protein JXC34_02275 [Candidatus Woesearchaeota archaeon]|nr:hypothetical protein [Candidatus Woesearchaeota archaeon]